jgi:hypothetical protein
MRVPVGRGLYHLFFKLCVRKFGGRAEAPPYLKSWELIPGAAGSIRSTRRAST